MSIFKTCYKAEKERLKKEQEFKKFKKQMLKLEKSLNKFSLKYL